MTDSHYRSTEDQISEARGIFAAIFDEDLPEVVGDSALRMSINNRTIKGMDLLDGASQDLELVEDERYMLEQTLDEKLQEIDTLEVRLEGMDISLLASNLFFELQGRLLTETPEDTVKWISEALRELSGHEGDDAEDVAKATTKALRLVVA